MHILMETFSNACFSATFHWEDGLLSGIDLAPGLRPSTRPQSPFGVELALIVENYALLDKDEWPELPLATRGMSPFSLRVLGHLREHVTRGTWTTYKQLAAACASPRGARAVGRVMASNPWPLVFPCHRVLAVRGLGGFGPGLDLKRVLLNLEGVCPPLQRPT